MNKPGNDGDSVSKTAVGMGDLTQQLGSFNRVFWVANTMEMLERLAYYGLRTVLPVYMVLAVEQGGPQFDHVQKGSIYAWWAAVQSGLPIFTGGYADKYGYKLTVAIAIAIKIAGYLVMAYAVEIGGWFTDGASIGVPGHFAAYTAFTIGALLLAAGTAIFKPGLQGIIAHQLQEGNASLGWSLFYQLVNVGGFLGPPLAGVMRLMAWKYVFISCAVIVALNYLFLFVFEEPKRHVNADQAAAEVTAASSSALGKVLHFFKVLWDSSIGICEPRLMAFLVVFSGFWMMFHQLFDLLPNFIDDWVDSSGPYNAIMVPVFALFGSSPPVEWGGNVPQEHMININAGMCMLLAFIIGYLSGKVRSMVAMIAGILVSSVAIWALGFSQSGWFVLAAIALFSLGELLASPTKMRYFASIAPPEKKGLYLGYINATGGIGWFIGSMVAGQLYEHGGDKVVLARRHLVDAMGLDAAQVAGMAKTDVIPALAAKLGTDANGVRDLLWTTYSPQFVWAHFALIGIVSMIGLIAFDQVMKRKLPWEAPALVGLTFATSAYSYGLSWAVAFAGLMVLWLGLNRFFPKALPA